MLRELAADDPKRSTGPSTADSHHYALQGMLPVIVSSVV